MNILGISCFYHDSAASLIQDGKIIAAVQEERFTRVKGTASFPLNAIDCCLMMGGLSLYDIDYIAFYEKPFLKFSRAIISHLKSYPFSFKNFLDTMPNWLDDRLILPLLCKRRFGFEGKTLFVKHHLSHAASTFLVSPFEEAAILTVDGVGEWATACFGVGKGNSIKILKEICFPDSLGLLYTAVTTYLGFRTLTGEGKVMALAGYGKPIYLDKLREIVQVKEDGSFRLNDSFFCFNHGFRMYSRKFIKAFGRERKTEEEIEERHCDIAASLQNFIEETLIKISRHVYNETKSNKLCLAGGVFLNCVVNTKILKETPFKEIFIQPAAGDSGGALGTALYVYHSVLRKPRFYTMTDAYLGPEFLPNQIKRLLLKRKINFKEFEQGELVKYVAQKISQDKVIAWFQGRMEWGPRALGNRCILANPANPEMKDILNKKVKHRENFRPYGVSILLEELSNYFDLDIPSPFMLLVSKVKESKKNLIPSAVHVDGTSRIQTITKKDNGIFYELVKEFQNISGIPMIINTSFNIDNGPIVCSPEDAYSCFLNTNIGYLVLGNCVVEKT